jgi:hypothetical protein
MKKLVLAALAIVLPLVAVQATVVNLNDTIPAIYGSGNPGSGWVSSAQYAGGPKLALMAHNRSTGQVPNNGDGSFSFPVGTAPGNANRALWNFDFSVTGPVGLNSSYILSITGPGGVNTSFNLENIPDNAYATSTGVHTGLSTAYINDATVMQNSENIKFGFIGGDPNLAGDYLINLRAFNTAWQYTQNEVSMTVHVGSPSSVPEVSPTMASLGGAFCLIILLAHRGRRLAAVRITS